MDSLTARVIIRMKAAMMEEGIGPNAEDGLCQAEQAWKEPMVADVLRDAYAMGGHYFTTRYLYEAGFVDEAGTPL